MEKGPLSDEPKKGIVDLFDNYFIHITDRGKKVPFSAERILSDLIDSGIAVLDALDILYECRPEFKENINVGKIVKILNRAINNKGYDESNHIRGNMDPLVIQYEDREENLNFKTIKNIVSTELMGFTYSTKTFKVIVDELHRILKSIRNNRFKYENIKKLIPSVSRSILNVDPFDNKVTDKKYSEIMDLYDQLITDWFYLPEEDQPYQIIEILENSFQIILLKFNFLPGHNFLSTISQIESLINYLTSEIDSILTKKEIYTTGKIANSTKLVLKTNTKATIRNSEEWLNNVKEIVSVVLKLMNRKTIQWIVVVDHYEREIYSRFSNKTDDRYRNLLGMAIGGFQSLLKEVTADNIKIIEQEDGVIVIEPRKFITVLIFCKQKLNTVVKSIISDLASDIEKNTRVQVQRFKGEIKEIQKVIDPLVDHHLGIMLED